MFLGYKGHLHPANDSGISKIIGPEGYIYTADMFFKDLFSRLFCDFKADSEVSFSRMDMQVVCVNTLLESVADASVPVVKWKLQELGERLKALAGQHEDGAVRKLYAMLSSRIEKVLNK